jgi:hypothetical protein
VARPDQVARAAAQAAAGGRPVEALLVQRLDGGPAYYLVPVAGPGGVDAIVQVDERGTVEAVSRLTAPRPLDELFLPTEAARAVAPAGYEPTGLVWSPVRESTSPVRPFHRLRGPSADLFVDMSGRVLPNLTPLGKG